MSIVFLKSPNNIDFCGNGLSFKLRLPTYKVRGEKAVRVFNFNSSWINGYFEFIDFDNEANITVGLLGSGADYEVVGGSDLKSITNQLNSVYIVHKHYNIYESGGRLYIYTRPERYVPWGTLIYPTNAFSVYMPINGANPEYKENFSVVIAIDRYLYDHNLAITEAEIYPDKNETAMVDIGKLIKPYLNTHVPDLSAASILNFEILRYLVSFYEKYPNENNSLEILTGNVFSGYALGGKIDFEKYPDFNIITEISTNKIFLNNNKHIELWKDANYFLHFMNPKSVDETQQVRCKIYYTDLSTHEITIFSNTHSANKGFVYLFPCSISALNLGSYNQDKEIFKYEIWVEHADNSTLCDKVVFYVIEKPMFFKEFAFVNEFGIYEFINLSCRITRNLNTKKKVHKKNVSIGYTSDASEYFVELDSAHNDFEIETGGIDKKLAIGLEYMLLSGNFFEIENVRYIPCIIDDGKFEIVPESEDIVSIKFSYRRAFDK